MGTTLHVDEAIGALFSEYCKERGLKVGFVTEELLLCILSGSISGSSIMKEIREYKIVYG